MIDLVLSDDALVFGLGMDFGFILLEFVEFMDNYFNNVGLIFYMGLGIFVEHILFVVDLSGGEVCLEVWSGLVGGSFFFSNFRLRWQRCMLW